MPGTRPRDFAAGAYGLPTGLIIGQRSADTESKLQLNEMLREFGSSVVTIMVKELRSLLNVLRNLEGVFDAYRVTPS